MRNMLASVRARMLVLVLGLVAAGSCRSSRGAGTDPFLKLTETDLEGDSTTVRERPGIVDINSSIRVDLQRAAIADELNKVVGKGGPSEPVLQRLESLAKSVENAKVGLQPLGAALREWSNSKRESTDNQKLTKAFTTFAEKIDPVMDLIEPSPDMRARFEREINDLSLRAPESSQLEQDRILLEIASDWVRAEREKVQREVQEQGGYLRMGAWLDRDGEQTPIHLPGFDTHPVGQFYEVDRWKIALTEDQKQKLDELEKTAQQINDAGGDPKLLFQAWANNILEGARNLLDACIEELKTKADDFAKSQAPTIAQAQDLREAVDDLVRLARKLRDKYSDFDARSMTPQGWLDALSGLQDDFDEVVMATRAVIGKLEALKAVASTIPQSAKSFFDSLVQSKCVQEIDAKLRILARDLGIHRAAAELQEFSEAVLKLDITQLPESTEFDLRRTGLREPQDRVTIRLAAGKASDPGSTPTPESTIARRDVDLELVLPHLETTVGLIFANPNGKAALTGEYQAAPSYSVLYKWGSRESLQRNTLLDWGVGLNLSALDFDKDDTPELGIAAVVAGLHNYLQAGYGYDPFEDRFYWFFGINLPLPTWSFPVAGTSK